MTVYTFGASGRSINSQWDSLSQLGFTNVEAAESILSEYDTSDFLPNEVYDYLALRLQTDKQASKELKVKLEVLKAKSVLFVGDYRLALRLLSNARRMIADEPDNEWHGTITFIYATVSTITNNPAKSKLYLEELFEFTDKGVPLFNKGYLYQLYASNLLALGELDRAESYYALSFPFWKKVGNQKLLKAWYYRMGILKHQRGQLDESKAYLKTSAQLKPEDYYFTHSSSKSYDYLAKLYYDAGALDSAYHFSLLSTQEAGIEHDDETYASSLLLQSSILLEREKFYEAEKALKEYRFFLSKKDSTKFIRQQKSLGTKGTSFEDVLEEVSELQLEKEKNLDFQRNQSIVQVIMIIGICFVAGLSVFLFLATRKLGALNSLLSSKNLQIQRAQAKLVETEKMAVIGQLSSVISHEINSPLGVIRATAEYLIDGIGEDMWDIMNDSDVFNEEAHEYILRYIQSYILSNSKVLSTREERKQSKLLLKELEAYNIADSKQVYDMLIQSKIYEIDDLLLKILRQKENIKLLLIIHVMLKWLSGVGNIYKAVMMTDKISNAMKNYAFAGVSEEKVSMDLVENLESVLEIYEFVTQKGVEINKELAPVCPIIGFPEQLKQVWSNLIVNALHAINNNGRLKITTKELGEMVCVTVEDNGHGIPEDIIDKIFDPLFTTKDKGEGSGLGLDIINQIVKAHNGEVKAESVPGRTTFTVLLPKAGSSKKD